VEGDLLGTTDGHWVLTTAADGTSTCVPGEGDDGPVLAPRGLALLFSGAQSCAAVRCAGLMRGDDGGDAVLDALLGGRQVHVRDYF
jgi:hypothetical protein